MRSPECTDQRGSLRTAGKGTSKEAGGAAASKVNENQEWYLGAPETSQNVHEQPNTADGDSAKW